MPRRRITRAEDKPVTLDRIEAALDGLAQIMIMLGADGPKALPIYERLEREAATLRTADLAMDRVRERASLAPVKLTRKRPASTKTAMQP